MLLAPLSNKGSLPRSNYSIGKNNNESDKNDKKSPLTLSKPKLLTPLAFKNHDAEPKSSLRKSKFHARHRSSV